MNKSKLIKLIQECYSEVISEESSATIAAKTREKQEREQYLKARKAATDAEINDLKRSTSLSENDLEEMARIPTLYNLSPDANPEEYTGTIKQIAQYLKDNPNQTKMEIAKGIGKNAQQAVNMIVKAMEEKGIIDSGGLKSEPKYKKSDGLGTGLRGRKISPEGAKKRAIKSVYDKLMAGLEDEITFEEDELIGDEDMQKIRDLVAQGGIKRGRKPANSDDADGTTDSENIPSDEEMFDQEEEEMFDQNDDDLLNYSEPEEEPISFENEPELATDDELTNLINKKDELLGQLKRKEIDLSTYKELVGDIPQRIKALQSSDEEDFEDDLNESYIKERMLKIAGIKK